MSSPSPLKESDWSREPNTVEVETQTENLSTRSQTHWRIHAQFLLLVGRLQDLEGDPKTELKLSCGHTHLLATKDLPPEKTLQVLGALGITVIKHFFGGKPQLFFGLEVSEFGLGRNSKLRN